MTSVRETALAALAALIDSAIPGVAAGRNVGLPALIPPGGTASLFDGASGDPEVLLSPTSYIYDHRAELQIAVEVPAADAPAAGQSLAAQRIDALLAAVGAALDADPTLGGAAIHCEPEAPQINDLAIEGAADIKGVLIPIIIIFETHNPLT